MSENKLFVIVIVIVSMLPMSPRNNKFLVERAMSKVTGASCDTKSSEC